MADIASTIAELHAIGDHKAKLERYKAVLQDLVSKAAMPQLQAFVQHLVSEEVQLAVSRQVLLGLAQSLKGLQPAQLKDIGLFTLEKMGPRVVSFEEQVSVIREELALVYEKEEDWGQAAKMLAGIPLDSGIRVLDDNYKVDKCIQIAMLYMQDDESVTAETFINRASVLIGEETEPRLRLQHKVCYARILDAKRKFLEAATRFYQLSQLQNRNFGSYTVKEEELTTALGMAMTCSILAPAGPQVQVSRLCPSILYMPHLPISPLYVHHPSRVFVLAAIEAPSHVVQGRALGAAPQLCDAREDVHGSAAAERGKFSHSPHLLIICHFCHLCHICSPHVTLFFCHAPLILLLNLTIRRLPPSRRRLYPTRRRSWRTAPPYSTVRSSSTTCLPSQSSTRISALSSSVRCLILTQRRRSALPPRCSWSTASRDTLTSVTSFSTSSRRAQIRTPRLSVHSTARLSTSAAPSRQSPAASQRDIPSLPPPRNEKWFKF